MIKVTRFYRDEEINSWTFNTEKEAEKYINEREETRLEGYIDQLRFTREETK